MCNLWNQAGIQPQFFLSIILIFIILGFFRIYTGMERSSMKIYRFLKYASKFGKLSVATGLEKVSFHSNPKERQWQRMLKRRNVV